MNMQTLTESSNQSSVASLSSRAKAGRPYIYVVGANGTAVIDPTNFQHIVTAPGVAPGAWYIFMDNHYRDQFGRLWGQSSALEESYSALAGVYITDPKTFRNEKTISLGYNAVHTVGLTPDGKFAVVPISTTNQLNVYDTKTYEQVATVNVGDGPFDMMISSDGKYCCVPEANSDTLTVVDPKTWKVIGKVPTSEGSGSFMVTIWPNNKFASVECSGYHGGKYNLATGPPAAPTGKGFAIKYVDLTRQSVIKSIPLDFLAVWDEFTPDGKYDFVFGPLAAKTVVVDTGTLEVTETIELQSEPTLNGYITPDPNGKYVYASVKTGLQVIDTSSLQIVDTIPTGGVVGTPFLLT
jgi:DNA-binding beta-propeller fold protein YncE